MLRGDDRLLGIEDQVFLSEKMAERIFGKEDPIGKQLLYGKNYPYTVAGIFRDIPENSHLRFDAVASFINMKPSSVPMPVGVPTIVIWAISA